MAEPSTDAEVSVTFYPQEWVDSPGEAHDWDKKRLVPAPDSDPVSFTVPREDATDDTGAVFADESYEANLLQSHPSAPDWVRNWDGPYYVRTDDEDE
ncbi:hypothetical protein [Halolamina salina]|uniref:Uncharacterized protein n=1 Tax=Halolamina salina TaxID=1220023 RepID=A0ABD6B4M8_9EURY